MNKMELIDAVAKGAGISKVEASKAVDTFTSSIQKSLKKGEKVTLVGFGTFGVVKKAARMGRNPKTGKPIKIAAKRVAKFKAGKQLADTIR
ncbi:MAG: HU family DNA-binding protein [Acidobacteria bacterium]|jgi:DNA-binding protein HU-beta|nr:HU family DNA-binding protein [Acidobacteriota bacterium]